MWTIGQSAEYSQETRFNLHKRKDLIPSIANKAFLLIIFRNTKYYLFLIKATV